MSTQRRYHFSAYLLVVTLALLGLAIFNLWRAFSPAAFREWLLVGAGIYWLVIAVAAVSFGVRGTVMESSGTVAPSSSLSKAERDKRWILKYGGIALSAGGLGLMLVALWLSQGYVLRQATSASAGEGIGFYDLMTWLGTFATFVVVVATALVAMYVKRRDDDTRHSFAIMTMRQAWIDKVRLTLSRLMAHGETLRGETNPNKVLAAEARQMLREIELQLNPTEGHHAVLLKALRAWLHEAGNYSPPDRDNQADRITGTPASAACRASSAESPCNRPVAMTLAAAA